MEAIPLNRPPDLFSKDNVIFKVEGFSAVEKCSAKNLPTRTLSFVKLIAVPPDFDNVILSPLKAKTIGLELESNLLIEN